MTMEVSAMPPMPLDFSMVRNGSGSPGSLREGSPRPVSNSAFRVVTPKGRKMSKKFLVCEKKLFVLIFCIH